MKNTKIYINVLICPEFIRYFIQSWLFFQEAQLAAVSIQNNKKYFKYGKRKFSIKGFFSQLFSLPGYERQIHNPGGKINTFNLKR